MNDSSTSEVNSFPINDTSTPNTLSRTRATVMISPMWNNIFLSNIVLVFIINTLTLIAVAGNRHLRKRTFFLVINLIFADLLGGVVSRPLLTYVDPHETMPHSIIVHVVEYFFLGASLVSLSLISLDRLHATLHPFRHCLIEKHVYFKVIACSWVIALLMASLTAVIKRTLKGTSEGCVPFSYTFITLIIITVSYISIRMKVKRTSHSHSGVISSEKKLSLTLFVMTAAYMLTILPLSTWWLLECSKCCQHQLSKRFNIEYAVVVVYSTNAIVNPLIYALRMREFRKGIKIVFCRVVGRNVVQPHESN
ncbi:melanocortin receptor 4-like [Acropora millepora]|uniref:melanocortin receptor 4-like n=1 Tax=Acropora millepora TaxID=45264 RepID=UPI001CF4BDDA|nr:melanocortin receptor 4-like [Acropora millepora]XP_044174752.1 melanocortin receptor 4-like [Acropora millepora]